MMAAAGGPRGVADASDVDLRKAMMVAKAHRADEMPARGDTSEKKRSGRAMPATANTRDCDGTTTDSGELRRRARRAERAGHLKALSRCPTARATRSTARRITGRDERGIGDRRRRERLAQPAGRQRPIAQVVLGDQQQIDVRSICRC